MTFFERVQVGGHKLWVSGGRLRCPNCEQGRMFNGLFALRQTCPVCQVRYERLDGESIGGMAITMLLLPSLAIGGFVLTDVLTGLPFAINAGVWGVLIVLGCVWMYRHSRAAWIAVSYLTGGVYADPPQPDTTTERAALVAAVRASRPKHDNPTQAD